MWNVFLFCIGMLIAYYAVAFLTDGTYSGPVMIGWAAFAACSPFFAYFTWMTKEKGVFPKMISAGIVLFSFLSSIILFDRLRIYDLIINGFLIYYLFFKKVER